MLDDINSFRALTVFLLSIPGLAMLAAFFRAGDQQRQREKDRAEAEARLRELGVDRDQIETELLEATSRIEDLIARRAQLEQQVSANPGRPHYVGRLEDVEGELGLHRTRLAELKRRLAVFQVPASDAELARLLEERAERRQLETQLADYQRVVPFEVEGRSARWTSTIAFLSGVAIVLLVLGLALWDWLEDEDGEALTTGTGLARLGAVLAAFYVAGQLFKRSTALQIRAQEFERAAIAMKVTSDLAEQIADPAARDQFVMKIYLSHLTSSAPPAGSDGASGQLDIAAIIDGYNKLRAGGA